ncbi:Arc family DNA-binding protein [Rhizobium sp. PL01]|uniref:Arc family DNA-binding protein n=1 Tax=Rhizobium sp. PL01 TaxID=3085631 RepID=UPI002980F409|nr:Arc family DNA-binding protein [Rhizobium sp. PL01]MDW5313770.1 Arc family DNA-binding protein [Rhizobium sp. PL01]
MKDTDLKIRLPAEIKRMLAATAEANDRSMNKEIIQILKAKFGVTHKTVKSHA